jgi:uncharacterized membrane protein
MNESAEPGLGRLEVVIGRLLRAGIATSSLCLAAGLIMTIAGVSGAMAGMALSAGLVILLATPVARVVVSVTEYLRERDWMFVSLTLGVLLALAGSAIAAFW